MISKLRLVLYFSIIMIMIAGCSSRNQIITPTGKLIGSPQVNSTNSATATAIATLLASNPYEKTSIITPHNDEIGFGVEILQLEVDFSKIRELGAKWVRYNGVLWSDVEPQEGIYHWEKLADLEVALRQANEAGLNIILIVRSTPTWAQKVPGSYCGAISSDKMRAFASFMSSLTRRYNTEPLMVKYWELWNEPDVDPSLVGGNSVFGCWGDKADEFYGGGFYAEMLKVVTPSIRAANPKAKIFLGGLLLDCDPTSPGSPGRCKKGYEQPPKFFEGILKSDGGQYINFVSYHGYPSYNPKGANPLLAEFSMPSWQARGGVVIGKANFLREVMAKYGVNIPLFLTESALTCNERLAECNPPGPEFRLQQAQYGAWLLVRNYAEGIGTIWFTFDGPGWRSSGILDEKQNKKPLYFSLQYVANLLQGSQAVRRIEDSNFIGYEFSTANGKFSFLYPIDGRPKIILVQDNKTQTFDIFGNRLPDN